VTLLSHLWRVFKLVDYRPATLTCPHFTCPLSTLMNPELKTVNLSVVKRVRYDRARCRYKENIPMRRTLPALIISSILLSCFGQYAAASPIAPAAIRATSPTTGAQTVYPGQTIAISCGYTKCTRVRHAYPYSNSNYGYYSPYDVPYYGYYRPWGWSDLNRSWWHW
jgi:hypothetical protein